MTLAGGCGEGAIINDAWNLKFRKIIEFESSCIEFASHIFSKLLMDTGYLSVKKVAENLWN